MTSNSYRDYEQTAFNGGIETRQESLEKNQLLDANNYWYPNTNMKQRPGVYARRFRGGLAVSPSVDATTTLRVTPSSDATAANPGGGTASVITPNVTNLNAFAFGDAMVLHFTSVGSGGPQGIREITLNTQTVTNAVTKTRVVLQAWTGNDLITRDVEAGGQTRERGWVTCWSQLNTNSSSALQPFAVGSQRLSFAAPVDTKFDTITFSTGALSGYFFRLIFVSATDTTGAPMTAGIVYGNGVTPSTVTQVEQIPSTGLNPSTTAVVPGAWFIKYSGGNRFVNYFQTPQRSGGSPAYTDAPRLEVFTSDSIQRTTLLDQGVGTEPARYDSRYKTPEMPPTIAVIPEFNTAFIAYCNLVLEQKYAGPWSQLDTYSSGSTFGPLVAQVNTDPNIVGTLSVSNPSAPYPADQIPQLTGFPEASLITYFKNQLFASGIAGAPTLIRWSGSANEGAYNVWPEDNQVTLSTEADNSPVTALAAMGDNLVAFKKNSIWLLIDNGTSDLELPLYEPRKVVSGVGTSSPLSIQQFNGGLMFLAEDGFYFFDGTPNIKRLSDPIKSYVDQINPARTPFAVSTLWRTNQAYICACSPQGEDQKNTLIFVYDYQNGGWWMWEGFDADFGWDIQCWLQVDGVGLQEELWFIDSFGRAFQLGRWTQTDYGGYINSWFLTGRQGFGDVITKTSRELRLLGTNNNPLVTYTVIGDDIIPYPEGATNTYEATRFEVTMPLETEARWNDPFNLPADDVADVPKRRRMRKSPNRTTALWFQVKVYKLLEVFGWVLGIEPEERR